ncbi:MAG: glycosyl transferase [Clostridia bacterium]|nr:glycosyl transferase [Clostridia bacterium]
MISLLYAGNEKVFDGILISALSAARHASRPLSVTLLTMDLTDQNAAFTPITEAQRAFLLRVLQKENPQNAVSLLDIGALYREKLLSSPNAATSYSPYCFLRLFADKLDLPEKVLYLDADTVINGDLAELFDTDLTGYEYGAVLDYYGKIFMGRHYFNSGVMLLNLPEIRRTGLFAAAADLCARKRLFLPDQTALYRCTKRNKLLPRRFNEQKKYDRPDTVIQHFTKTILWLPYFHTRTIKPWQPDLVKQTLTRRYDALLDEAFALKHTFEEETR